VRLMMSYASICLAAAQLFEFDRHFHLVTDPNNTDTAD
jgi:hypothetical protein